MSPKDALTAEEQKNNLDLNQDKIIKNSNLNKKDANTASFLFVIILIFHILIIFKFNR